MYQLTCPFCRLVLESSFVRIGAVMRCPECNKVYQIGEHHVNRTMSTAPVMLGEPLLVGDPVDPVSPRAAGTSATITAAPPKTASSAPVAVKTAAPAATARPAAVDPLESLAKQILPEIESATAASSTSQTARVKARKLAVQRQQRTLLWLLLAIMMLALCIGLLLYYGPTVLKIKPDKVPAILPSSSAPGDSHAPVNP